MLFVFSLIKDITTFCTSSGLIELLSVKRLSRSWRRLLAEIYKNPVNYKIKSNAQLQLLRFCSGHNLFVKQKMLYA